MQAAWSNGSWRCQPQCTWALWIWCRQTCRSSCRIVTYPSSIHGVGLIALAAAVVACGWATSMSDEEVARCLELSNRSVSPSLLLPDEAIAPAGSSDEVYETTFDRVFHEVYGIHVDDFLAIERIADAETTAHLGEPPGAGEMVTDEWFRERDARLLELWNERDPDSARAYCELVEEQTKDRT